MCMFKSAACVVCVVTIPFLLLVPCAPTTIHVTTIMYQNNSVHDVELFWMHREVIMYNIMTNHL